MKLQEHNCYCSFWKWHFPFVDVKAFLEVPVGQSCHTRRFHSDVFRAVTLTLFNDSYFSQKVFVLSVLFREVATQQQQQQQQKQKQRQWRQEQVKFLKGRVQFYGRILLFNLLKPNDIYICRTAALTSRRYILNIYSTSIHTEYFKHAA